MALKIALAGNPNCGKTTLFNALTGANQFVGNWPGVTVEKKEGKLKGHSDVVIMDLPGIYSLSPYTLEEVVARGYLVSERPDAILNIIDGTNLERNLYLSTQLLELGIPVVMAINMMDVVKKNGDQIFIDKLSEVLGCKVVEISALKGTGVKEAAEAAVHSGAGKVTLAVPKIIKQIVQSRVIPEVMVTSTETNKELFDCRQVVAMGPGLGRTREICDLVDHILDAYEGALVLDADALYAVGHVGCVNKDALRDGDIESAYTVERELPYCVMTPHLGEFSRLIDLPIKWIERHYITLAREFAKAHQVILVLKGIPSIVAFPDGTVYVNTIGNAGMGTGGMGDVLTGVIAGFISQGYSLQDSAILGVYVHSRSADILNETKSWGYTPSDVSASLGFVVSELLGDYE